jgi:hypothetical protein
VSPAQKFKSNDDREWQPSLNELLTGRDRRIFISGDSSFDYNDFSASKGWEQVTMVPVLF